MMRFTKDSGNRWWLALPVGILVVFLILALTSCGSTKAEPGSAVDFAAGANARSESLTTAADSASVQAAAKAALAAEYERLAKEKPTQLRIDAAVAARLDAATSRAVADALAVSAESARKAALDAQDKAAKERVVTAKAEADAGWLYLCRLIGLAGVASGAILGGLLCWFCKGLLPGVPVGGIIAGTGLLVVAFGQTVTWLPVALGAVLLVGLVVWAVLHARVIGAATALSHAVDAARGETLFGIDDALAHVKSKIKGSGIGRRIAAARTTWKINKE
jgi:hypothetical protein